MINLLKTVNLFPDWTRFRRFANVFRGEAELLKGGVKLRLAEHHVGVLAETGSPPCNLRFAGRF
jgi:hypothetical protein